MNKEEVQSKLQQVFEEVFRRPIPLSPTLTARDVKGWDSITHLTLMIQIESTFKIRFPLGKVSSMNNVGELIDYIVKIAK